MSDDPVTSGGDDAIVLSEDVSASAGRVLRAPWKVLVVDDEREVHAVTALALEGFSFAGRGLELISAYTGEQAIAAMREQPDIALILLDVVMESDQAGLEVVRYIREDLQNRFVRIILRTGQPGQAPEFRVITEYDINDYKEKTELTRQKLFTCVYTSLSAYRDLMALEKNRRGLVKVIESSAHIFELKSLERFAEGVLEQLTALLYLEQDVMVLKASGIAAEREDDVFCIVAAIGRYRALVGEKLNGQLPDEVRDRIRKALNEKANLLGEHFFAGYYRTDTGVENILYIAGDETISIPDVELVELFARNVVIAHENLRRLESARVRRRGR